MVAFTALGPTAQTAIPRLGRLARDPEHNRSSRGAIALAQIGPLAIPELLAILSDTTLTPDARFGATRELDELLHPVVFTGTLGTSGDPAVPLLIHNLNDPDQYVAGEAACVLGTLHVHPDVCIPALIAALTNTNSVVRDRAATALPNFGHNARAAVPALLTAIADPDIDVRTSATNALRYIAPEVLADSTAQ
jgi:HEAT repeat protein